MPTLELHIQSATVRFTAANRRDTIAQFNVWLQAIPPAEWNVAANLGPHAHTYLRTSGQGVWNVNTFLSPNDPGARGRYIEASGALHAFSTQLMADGDHWPITPAGQAHVTLILPGAGSVLAEGDADARAGVVWLLDWMREHRQQEMELRASHQAQATALFYLNRGELVPAREALAALTLNPGEFDIAALPPPVYEALEELAQAAIRPDVEALRRRVHQLLNVVGLGWTEAQIAAELKADAEQKAEPARAA
jgi:hypothetical protein